ncbi:MAG: hypothetical protein LBS10_10490 [Gracilibacteraceae bacterium]|jgi:hypothetical protein|nr:hypothetical protein [Gracilibacteraceae bacterium]
MAYVKWDCAKLELSGEELRETLSRLSTLTEEMDGVFAALDLQLANYEEIERSLRALRQGAAESVSRLGSELSALEGAAAVYAGVERLTLRASEDLPAGIAEPSLVFEDWFTALLG